MAEDVRENTRNDGQGFESMNMRDHQRECIIEIGDVLGRLLKGDIQRGAPGALDVGPGFFDVLEVQIGPQRGTGNEYLSPTATYVGAVD